MSLASGDPRRRKLMIGAAVVLLLTAALAAAWRWTPLHDFAEPERIGNWLAAMRDSPKVYVIIPLLYVAANLVLFPNTILNAATILGLGTRVGFPLALGSSVLAAVVLYAIGRKFGARRLRKLDAESIERLQQALDRSGVLGMAALRLVPIAPYGVVNAMAGACKVRLYVYVFGTTLGLLPGNLLVTAFGHQLRAILEHPEPGQIAIMLAIVAFAGAAMWWLNRGRKPWEREEATA